MNPLTILLITSAGGLGVLARYLIQFHVSSSMPVTLFINILGSAIFGGIMGLTAMPDLARTLLTAGFLGGFTTFSAFSFELLKLSDTRSWISFFMYGFGAPLMGWLFCLGSYLFTKRFL